MVQWVVVQALAGRARGSGLLRLLAFGLALPALAATVARATWDGHYLVTPAAFLLASVIVAALVARTPGAITAAVVSFSVYWWTFLPPAGSLAVRHERELEALVAFGAMAAGVVVVVDQFGRARRRATRYLAKLEASLANAPVAIGLVDTELRPLQRNQAMDELLAWPGVRALAAQVLRTGVAALDAELVGERDGRRVHLLVGCYPVGDRAGAIGVGLIARDVSDAKALEEERTALLERVSRLQRLTAALAAARTTPDVVAVVIDDVRRLVGADSATVCVVDGDELEMVGAAGYSEDMTTRWRRFRSGVDTPFGEAFRTGRLVLAGSADEVRRRWSGIDPDRVVHALAALPLMIDGEPMGAVSLGYLEPQAFDDGDVAFLGAVATQCAQALLRGRLYAAERAARESSEAAAVRLAFLAEASATMGSSLDWEETLRQVVEHAVPTLADACAVFVIGDDRQPRVLAQHWELQHLTLPTTSGSDQARPSLRKGESLFLPAVTIKGVEVGSMIAVPIRSQGETLGAIVLGVERPRALDEADLALATEWAARSGQAIANARLFREREHVAQVLQASLLPPATPKVPGLEVATRFFALGAGIDVGGDFYDVVRLGRPSAPLDRWAVVIGDVRGKGAEAAAITGAARHSIRASALTESSPRQMLLSLNELLLVLDRDQEVEEPRFCTAVVAVFSGVDGEAPATIAVGGHPMPLVLRADGRVEQAGAPGTVLGIVPDPDVTDYDLTLGPGDALVLYTDGVTERHESTRFFDEEGLAAVLSRCTGFTASALAERIETAARAFVEEAPRDDLAIVVVRMPTDVAATSTVAADLAPDPMAPHQGRAFVASAMEGFGVTGPAVEVATLLTSELVTNAVLHGGGPVRVQVETDNGHVRVSVSDGSPDEPTVKDVTSDATSGRGMHLLDELSGRWGVTPTPNGKSVWFELPVE